jgi:hypothetical protein
MHNVFLRVLSQLLVDDGQPPPAAAFMAKQQLGSAERFELGVRRPFPLLLQERRGAGPSRKIITGVNWAPGINNPFRQLGRGGDGMDAVLADLRANTSQPVIVALHLACPRVGYTDRGKSAIVVEGDVQGGDDGEE